MSLRRPNLKWKLAIGVSALSIVLIGVVSVVQFRYLEEDIGAQIATQQQALVDQAARDLDSRFSTNLVTIERSAELLPSALLDDVDGFRAYYAARPGMLLAFGDVILFDRDGIARADFPAMPGRIGVKAADRDYFRQALATGKPTISQPLFGRASNEPLIFMAAPVRDPDGRIVGVLAGTLRLLQENYLGALASTKVGRAGYFFMTTRGEKPVYVVHPDKSRILTERPATAAASTTRAIEGFEGTSRGTNSAGVDMVFSYRRLKTTDWLLASALPASEAYAPIFAARERMAWLAALIALGVTPFAWLFAWRLFAPVTRLLASINASRETVDVRTAGGSRNEFDQLVHAFEQLMRERDDADARLREKEHFVRSVTDNVPALVCYIDAERRFRFNNRQYERWLQKPLSEVTGRLVADVYGADVAGRLLPHIDRAFAGTTEKFEIEFVGFNGRTQYARGVYRPDVDANGTVRGVYGLINNVTELKHAEDALRDERARMAAIIEGTNAGTWEWNVVTGEARVNERWAAILGHTVDELAPVTIDTWSSRVHPADRDAVRAQLAAHFAGERDHHEFEARMRHKDGSWVWVLGYGRVSTRDAEGRPLLMHGVHMDIAARRRAEEDLRVSQRFLQRTGRLAGVGGWELDIATNAVSWSDETCLLHDVAPGFAPTLEEAVAFYRPDARPVIADAVRRAIADGTSWDLELPLVSASGRAFWARAVGAVESENGIAVRLFGAFQDVTARKAIERELSENRQLLQTTLDSIGDAVITTDVAGRVRWLNPVAERMTGWPRDEAVGRPLAEVFVALDEQTRVAADDPVAACVAQGDVVGSKRKTVLLSRRGEEFGIEDSASAIRDAQGSLFGVVLVFHDVSEQRRLTREMTHRATHDPLTGLVNRLEFETRLQRLAMALVDDGRANAVLYIDLDQFKLVNDSCGHAIGDQLLIQVAGMMRACVRSRDTVARLGGDEFGIILEQCDVGRAQLIAQKLCDDMEAFRFTHEGRRFRVGTSIGLVPFDSRWTSVAAAIQAADASCYAAKAEGRNRVHVWADTDVGTTSRHGEIQWVTRLEQALDEDRFELYAQRIVPIGAAPQRLHCEVLLRLRDVDGTIVPPGLFLPIAERFHLATRIDRWVLRAVFAKLESYTNFASDVEMISINLSGHSIGDRAFHRDVVSMIQAASFDVRRLCFEITETVAVTNFADAKLFVDEVRRMGVKVALDDFGAGASSFGYLKSLPVDFLKIDGQFITGLRDNALDDAAVRCFREVANVVGVKTIAEFVEHDDVQQLLQAIGIDMAQGYLIHRPEPLSVLTASFV